MKRGGVDIDRDPEVQRIARVLGIAGPNLGAKLSDSAVEKVARHMERFDIVPAALEDVHRVVLDLTGVRIERVENDNDLERISKKYAKNQAAAGVQLEFEFARNTEAVVFRHDSGDVRRPGFTALVDSRGEREHRAWFAERHEPAHLLIPDPSGKVAWRRTTTERPEPLEQVVDAIAARVGFWEPIVRPALDIALREEKSVLEAFERTRAQLAPRASRESCYRAFVRLVPFPLTLLRTSLGCRRGDPDNTAGSLCLRATTVIWNEAAAAPWFGPTFGYRRIRCFMRRTRRVCEKCAKDRMILHRGVRKMGASFRSARLVFGSPGLDRGRQSNSLGSRR